MFREVNVLDESGSFNGPVDVRVSDGVIEEVGLNLPGRDHLSVDFSGLWMLPGIFDCHTHVSLSSVDPMEALHTPASEWALEAGANMRRVVEAGVTHVRDAGGADAGIRQAVSRGLVPGPRLQLAIVMLCQTGGHADGYLPGVGLELSADYSPLFAGKPAYQIDGEEEMRRTVRSILRGGADWIKLCATGGVMAPHDHPRVPELSPREIEVAVYEAGKRGKGVMAHAFGDEGLTNAVRGGVRSIEHGTFLSEEQAQEMQARDCFLVPTLFVLRDVVRVAEQGGVLPPYAEKKALELRPYRNGGVEVARAAGVKLALGSDFIRRELHGRNLAEIPLLHEAGLTVEEALLAATINGAELCGVADRYGRLAPGYLFDAIVLDDDPSDLRVFERPGAVTGVSTDGAAAVRHPRLGG